MCTPVWEINLIAVLEIEGGEAIQVSRLSIEVVLNCLACVAHVAVRMFRWGRNRLRIGYATSLQKLIRRYRHGESDYKDLGPGLAPSTGKTQGEQNQRP